MDVIQAASRATDDAVVVVHDNIVHLRDLVDIRSVPLPLREAAGEADIMRLHARARPVHLSGTQLARRIRALVPALDTWAQSHVRPSYTMVYSPLGRDAPVPPSACLRALKPVEAGAMTRSDDFATATCEGLAKAAWFTWDAASRSTRTRRAITVGTTVPRFTGYGETRAYAGDRLAIETRAGPVIVQRSVTALQSARAGERLLLRTDDGTILSGPMEKRP